MQLHVTNNNATWTAGKVLRNITFNSVEKN